MLVGKLVTMSSKGSFIGIGAGVLLMALFSGVGCHGGSRESDMHGPGWVDLVADADQTLTQVRLHDDQTFLAVKLSLNNPAVRFTADLHNPVRIILSGGYSRDGNRSTREGVIRYRIEDEASELVVGVINLEPESLWWREVVEFPPSFVGTVRVSIEAEVRNAHAVLLREARIEQKGHPREVDVGRPQILLICVDTLREDALGVFGGPWRTPNLDRLAREGERWSPHYSGAGWTKPSHAVLLTGYRGDTHQMGSEESVMDPGLPTLAGRFKSAGFKTMGFVYDCKWLDPKWGFNRGFDEYRVSNWRVGRAVYQISNWVDAHRDDPFFLFFHTFEPHSDWRLLPYESPGTTVAEVADRFGIPDYGCSDGRCASRRLLDINSGVVQPLPNETAILRFLYGRGVEETDRALGELFSDLQRKGLWDNLLVIVTSDHGEAFYEHQKYLHGSLWNEIVRVPLLIKWPNNQDSGRVGTLATSSIDIGPTLLEFAGLDLDDLPGDPLQWLDTNRPISIGGPVRMLVQGDWKVLMGGNIEDVWFLSNTRKDLWEKDNLVDDNEDSLPGLLKKAREFMRKDEALREKYWSDGVERTVALSEEETAKLEVLGYLE